MELHAWLPRLRQAFDGVFLIRNERQLILYEFDRGRRFEPDYLLLLARPELQLHVFLEPKGDGFAAGDQWKEDFLLSLEDAVSPAALPGGGMARILGAHFFSRSDPGPLRRDLEDMVGRFGRGV